MPPTLPPPVLPGEADLLDLAANTALGDLIHLHGRPHFECGPEQRARHWDRVADEAYEVGAAMLRARERRRG